MPVVLRKLPSLSLLPWLLVAVFATSASADEKAFMWEVTGARSPVYLVGSIHVGNASFYPLPEAMEQAFRSARVLAVEADPTQPEALRTAMAIGFYPPGDNLEKHVPAALLDSLERQLPQHGLSLGAVAMMKPFSLMSMLVMAESLRLGYEPQAGVDLYFLKKAAERDMPVVELESIEAQLSLMDSLSDAEQQAILRQTLESMENGELAEQLGQMVSAWQRGDGPGLVAVVERGFVGEPEARAVFMEKINFARNRAMAQKIERFLHSGDPHFVVVGALHLPGEQGILKLLEKRHYRIRQR